MQCLAKGIDVTDVCTYQLKLQPSRQGWPLHCFDAVSGQPALLQSTQGKKKLFKELNHDRTTRNLIFFLSSDSNALSDVVDGRCELQNVPPMLYVMCQKNKQGVKISWTRSLATAAEEVLLWIFPIESFYTTSYLIFRRLLSTDSSRTSWGKRTISLSWSPCENKASDISIIVVRCQIQIIPLTKYWDTENYHIYNIVWIGHLPYSHVPRVAF